MENLASVRILPHLICTSIGDDVTNSSILRGAEAIDFWSIRKQNIQRHGLI